MAAKPHFFRDAIILAKTFEEKYFVQRKYTKPPPYFPQSHNTPNNPSNSSTLPKTTSRPLPYTKLSPNEIMTRRDKDQCYTCDEKWFPGHKCKNKRVYIMEGFIEIAATEDNSQQIQQELECIDDTSAEISLAILLQAMSGIPVIHTFRINGSIEGHQVHVLVDSGSTHNFINNKLAHQLGLTINQSQEFQVLVASGETMTGNGECKNVQLKCQETQMP